jgi:hypothetical protein
MPLLVNMFSGISVSGTDLSVSLVRHLAILQSSSTKPLFLLLPVLYIDKPA